MIMAVFLWHQNGVRRCLACASGLRDWGRVESRSNRAKTAQQYFVVRAVTRRFHALVEIGRDRRMPVVCQSDEPQCDPNQLSALPVIDFNRLTPCEAKETHQCLVSV